MTPEDIKKVREFLEHTVPKEAELRTHDEWVYLAKLRAGYMSVLDEVERLQDEIAGLKTAMKNDIALYKEIMADVRGGKAADQAEELRKLNAVAEAAENIGRLLVSEHGHRVAYVNFSQLFDALDTWRAKK